MIPECGTIKNNWGVDTSDGIQSLYVTNTTIEMIIRNRSFGRVDRWCVFSIIQFMTKKILDRTIMETIGEINELLTTKMCSPVIIYGIILVVSIISVYMCRERIKRYNTQKMENLYNMFTMQELKFMLVLGVVMFGLCQYKKTELAWIFLIFPVIYIMLQNVLLYVHVSTAVQNAPQPKPVVMQQYGYGMNAPLLDGQGPPIPTATQSAMPKVPPPKEQHTLPKLTSQSTSMGGGFGGAGSGMPPPSGFNL